MAFHLAGRDLRIDYSAEHAGPPINKLYFSGFVGEEQGLSALFASEIRSFSSVHALSSFLVLNVIWIVRDNMSGEHLSTGFVEFSSIAVANEALNKISGVATPNGARLSLNYAKKGGRVLVVDFVFFCSIVVFMYCIAISHVPANYSCFHKAWW